MNNPQIFIVACISALFCAACSDSTKKESLNTIGLEAFETMVRYENLYQPWDIEQGPDSVIWITENDSYVTRIDPLTFKRLPLTVNMDKDKQKSFSFFMHGLVFHPEFDRFPFVYLSYVYLRNGDTLTSVLDVVKMEYDSKNQTLNHRGYILTGVKNPGHMIAGGRMMIHENHLFVCTSDERTEDGTSLILDSLTGKILRLNLDGSIPIDNPFPNSPVFSYGHRNPQGLIAVGSDIFSTEHGPGNGDELNRITAGENYGWPDVSGVGIDSTQLAYASLNRVVLPLIDYTPTVAPSSLAYKRINDKDYFFIPTLKEADLRVVHYSNGEAKEVGLLLNEELGRLRDIKVFPNGRIFLLTHNRVQKNFHYFHSPNKNSAYQYDLLVEVFLN